MPKREDETSRRIYYGGHPPSCTCVKCTNRRLRGLEKEVHPSYVSICPRCGHKSLWHNLKENKYECLNLKCKATGRNPDEIAKNSKFGSARQRHLRSHEGGITYERRSKRFAHSRIPNWLAALLLISSLAVVGLIVNMLIGSTIPLWLLLGFSSIFAIEKWYGYLTRRHKAVSSSYRLLLNLSISSLFGLIVWSGIKLFSQQLVHNPLVGSLIFLAELGFFVWMCTVVAKNSWRWPSMKLTMFSLACLFLVLSFAGVQPMASYKDKSLSSASSIFGSLSKLAVEEPNPTPITQNPPTPTLAPPISSSPTPIPPPAKLSLSALEEETFKLINMERNTAGLTSTKWNVELYKLSKAHSQAMADRGELFHTPLGASYAENCWMGMGYSDDMLPRAIVDSWMSSPLHRAWILHAPIRTSVVSIVKGLNGVYASWTFWMAEVEEGPALVRELSNRWMQETGGSVPWIDWLKMKGYLK